MRVAEVPLDAIDDALLARWTDLAARAIDPNPFFEPDFVLAAVRHLAVGATRPAILIVDDSERMRACVPVVRRNPWRRVPCLTLSTWMHDYCFVGTPLVDPEDPRATVRELIRGATNGQFFALKTCTRVPGSTLDLALRGADSPCVVYEQFVRASLEPRVADTPAPLSVSAQRRRRLGRLARRLGDEVGGDVCLERATDPSAVEQFLELERSGWKGRAGTAFACRPGHHQFFREVCSRFDARGRLRVDTLRVGDRPAAIVCSLLAGDTRFLFKTAFDEQLARFSPGTQAVVASCDGETMPIDSCAAPTEQWLNELLPDRREVRTVLFPPAGRLDALTARALRAFVRARERARKRP